MTPVSMLPEDGSVSSEPPEPSEPPERTVPDIRDAVLVAVGIDDGGRPDDEGRRQATLDAYGVHRVEPPIKSNLGGIGNFQTFRDLSKGRVLAVKMRSIFNHDEEL